MVFSSVTFLLFFLPLVLAAYALLQPLTHKNLLLLLASLFFYAWGEPVYVLVMLLSIGMNFHFGQRIAQGPHPKESLWAGVFANLALLFLFKYQGFCHQLLTQALHPRFDFRLDPLDLPLPIGISFFTFQALCYLVDVYRGTAPVQHSVRDLGLYIAFFPQLVAGPIVRYASIAQQITQRYHSHSQFTQGVERLIQGLAKKVILANQFSLIAQASFGQEQLSLSFAWLGALAYSLQIYYDFSGYSDMAIGLGKLFGFDFSENFNYPYCAKTITDFWRRWHISLSSWFRDYVYIPLGGSRVGTLRLIFNLFLVWTLTGIWHGASFQFLAWGLVYFFFLTLEKLIKLPKFFQSFPFSLLYRLFTLLVVLCAWVIFGESSLRQGLHHLQAMFPLQGGFVLWEAATLAHLNNDYVLLLTGLLCATPLVNQCCKGLTLLTRKVLHRQKNLALCLPLYTSALCHLLLFFLSLSYLVMGSHNPFIYFNF